MMKNVSKIVKPPVATPFIKLREVGNAGVVMLDRMRAKNALSYEMIM